MTVGRLTKPFFVSLFVWAVLFGAPAFAKVPSVMVSLLPIHSLVQGVMGDLGEAELLLSGGASPHGFSLKPSQVRALARADLVIRVSADLETFLNKPLSTLSNEAKIVILIDTDGLQLFEIREGGDWEAHEEEAQEAEGRHAPDPHIWLSPENATRIVRRIAEELTALDPENAAQYHANATRLEEQIAEIDQEIASKLKPLRDKPYLVFHDAYQYFEKHYGLRPVGSVTVNPEISPGARRISEIRQNIGVSGALCLFSEPQFEPPLVEVLLEGTQVRRGELDPVGASLAPGPDAYVQLLHNMAKSLQSCLEPNG